MAVMFFKIKPRCGSHAEGGKVYRAGDIVPSEKDLVALFPFKFEKAVDNVPSKGQPIRGAVPPATAPQAQKPEEEKPSDTLPPSSGPLGKEVTEKFPSAKEQDFKVFAVPGGFNVYDADDLKSPLNKEVLKARKDIGPFVENFLKQGA